MLILFLASLFSNSVWAVAAPEPPQSLNYTVDSSVSYFFTNTNYNSDGQTQGLLNDGEFTSIQARFAYIQDWQKVMRGYGGAVIGFTESWDGVNSRSNSALHELFFGGQYWLSYEEKILIVPQGDFVYPLQRLDVNGADVPPGEGAMRIKAGAWGLYPIQEFTPFVYLGYEFRDEARSHLIPYSLGVKYKMDRAIWLQGEYRGYETIQNDDDSSDRVAREFYLSRVAGGSYTFYSVNPSVGELAVSAGYNMGSLTVYGDVAKTMAGANSAEGWTLTLGLTYSPVTSENARYEQYESEGPGPGFDATPIPEDTSLFKESSQEISPDVKTVPRPKPKRKPRKSNVDQLLQDTQKELEGL